MNHLAIYNKKTFNTDFIALMLRGSHRTGLKFLNRRMAPYQKLSSGDVIYLKEASGPIRGRVSVENVQNIEFNEPNEIMEFLINQADKIGIDSEEQLMSVFKYIMNSRYLCWWSIIKPQTAQQPVMILKNDRRVWVADYTVPEEVIVAFL